MPSSASTSPDLMASLVASTTQQIVVGSGGTVLPNHSPLDIAEHYAFLEAAFPGRIDLGVVPTARQDPASDRLQRCRCDDVEPDFAYRMHLLMDLLTQRRIRVTPAPGARPMLWVLGADVETAQVAAGLGLPFIFAAHRTTVGADRALACYRDAYQGEGQPLALITVNVVTGETAEEAWELSLPYRIALARYRAGLPEEPLTSVDEALDQPAPDDASILEAPDAAWFLGAPHEVAQRLFEMADRFQVNEIIVNAVGGARLSDPIDRCPSRETALRELMPLLGQSG